MSSFSLKTCVNSICDRLKPRTSVRFHIHNIDDIIAYIKHLLPNLQTNFGSSLNPLFFVSLILHRYFVNIERLIVIDVDIKVKTSLQELESKFDEFSNSAMIGIANEQQPIYRHLLYKYRSQRNRTEFGNPHPYGLPGLNSGVLLLHLQRMRDSSVYNSMLNPLSIASLANQYYFHGHLGDQDFYTLLSFNEPTLFYNLNCTWNRQLCKWWKYHGYFKQFDEYHKCDGKINLYHGNCNSVIPANV
ncbi:Xyloside xylosyltransferase 1-like protein [Dinothrombium tinctorium]|uniref:Xyloside xylosyltransferase 1-like protein n=1 Tax=Dinothrombium tinctorium TaxID=1965070 RepID=A0A3S3NVQ9_9ACAR|nr:Xyloside xylosyltransferase 1-like protein [Dinothrombium tinctorium]RWS06969.1 Xyloside xylosyltransferase 1-like protein [Dinothrombium tinctorium]